MKTLFKIIILIIVVVIIHLFYLRNCSWNPDEAARYVTEHAEKKSVGLCALYVRKAIMAGGVPLYWGGNACHYKYVLPIIGFEEIEKESKRKKGDIVVFQSTRSRKYGHIAIWNGTRWVSDFKQRSFYVHKDYLKGEYNLFRRE